MPSDLNPMLQAIDWLLSHITTPPNDPIRWSVITIDATVGPDLTFARYAAVDFSHKGLHHQTPVAYLTGSVSIWPVCLIDLGRIFRLPIHYEWPHVGPITQATPFRPIGAPWPEKGPDIYRVSPNTLPEPLTTPGVTWTQDTHTYVLERAKSWWTDYFYWRQVS